VNDLAERKQLLLAQSDAHRLLIRLECQNLQSSLRWLPPVERVAQATHSYGWVLGAAAGLMLAWRGRSLLKWPLRGLALWRLVRPFLKS
jgi:hypothetical protein